MSERGFCCQLFDSFINPVLSYACEIWGFSKSKEIERIHLKFLKNILNLKTTTFSASVYYELGRYPLFICRHVRIIKYWIKIINTENFIVKTIYNTMLNDAENGAKNWASNIKDLLNSHGFTYIWDRQHVLDLKNFHLMCKKRVIDEFLQKWYNDMNMCNYLPMLKYYMINFGYEMYLDTLPSKLRII